MRPLCVLLDWNGTVLNDLPITYEAMREIFRRHGLPAPTMEEYRNEIDSNFPQFYRNRGVPAPKEKLVAIWQEVVAAHWEEAVLHEGVPAFLRACLGEGLTLGIVSGEVPQVLLKRLEQFKLTHFFSVVRSAAWPKERALIGTLALLGVRPEEAVYVDDTTEGIRTAKRLGLRAFGFTEGYASPERIRDAEPHRVVSSFAELYRLVIAAE